MFRPRPPGRPASPAGPRLLAAVTSMSLAAALVLASIRSRSAAEVGDDPPWALEAVWPTGEEDVLGLAAAPDGGIYAVSQPRQTTIDHRALSRRATDGSTLWSRVVRDAAGRELRPIAVEAGPDGTIFLATADRLLAQAGDGSPLWEAPAGDGHPDFGPAARGLTLDLADGLLYGTDLVQARLLAYRAADGQRRLRLGTAGRTPGSFLAPIDVALGRVSGDLSQPPRLFVAEAGNRRLQRLDLQGNPEGVVPLPAAPRALAAEAGGRRLYALLADETVVAVDPATGKVDGPLLGGLGSSAGRFSGAWDLAVSGSRLLVADRGGRRILVFGRSGPPVTTAPGQVATPTAAPPAARLDACPGRPARLDWTVTLPPAAPRVDLLLAIDTTGSMESLISTVQSRTAAIADGLRAVSPDIALGLVDVRDFPYGQAGLPSDWPWQLRGALSTDEDDLAAAAATLYAGGGGDAPEAYAAAIAGALDSPLTGWRSGARRVIVLLGDSVPRDDDLNEGVANPKVPGVWTPGRPAWWRDSGADLVPDTDDDLDWQALLERLKAEQVTLMAAVSGAAPPELGSLSAELTRYWSSWTGRAGPGGAAVDLGNVNRLPTALADLLGASGRRIGRLATRVQPEAYAGWLRADPAEHRDVVLPSTGGTRSFALAIEAPPGTMAGRYRLLVTAVGDEARYGEQAIDLDWRPDCAPTEAPSASPPPEVSPTPPAPSATAPASVTPRPTPPPATSPPPPSLLLPFLGRGHCLALRRRPLDVVLVLDSSQSMIGAKLAAALAASQTFVDLVDLPRDHVAVVSFNGQARLASGLTGSRSLLELALATPQTGPGTRIDRGLAAADGELRGPRARPEARPVVVVLTDGQPDPDTVDLALAAARQARGRGVALYAIGLGADVDLSLLQELTADKGRVLPAPSPADLAGIYRGLAETIPCS